jgi:4-hydroxy-2-oxoheptanedioate aldolase
MHNTILSKIKGKKPFFGSTLMLGTARTGELMALDGYDFLMVDMQHGPFNKSSATEAVRILARTAVTPFARVADNTSGAINDLLDAGALGIVVPMVESAAQAEMAVRAAYYPPRGKRSRGGSAAAVHGDAYASWANDEIVLVVMIETLEGLEKAEEIFAVEGLTACLLGTSDLSGELQCPRTDARIKSAADKLLALGKRRGIAVGISIGNPAEVAEWQSLSPAFYLISHDQGLLHGASRLLADAMRMAIHSA